jgi:hypothetical protein
MSIQVEISKPIKDFEGNEVTLLTFQEPTFKDLIAMDNCSGGELEKLRTIFSSCSLYDVSELNKMSGGDVMKVVKKLQPFLNFQEEIL